MSKTPAKAPAPAAKSDNTASEVSTTAAFTLDANLPVPAITRGGGAASNYPFAQMAVGTSFLVPVTVPDTIKGDERNAAFKEEARRVSNRISGAVRRYRKSNAEHVFAIRTVNDDTLGHGVRVWRVEGKGK